jgi:hypothetical protein
VSPENRSGRLLGSSGEAYRKEGKQEKEGQPAVSHGRSQGSPRPRPGGTSQHGEERDGGDVVGHSPVFTMAGAVSSEDQGAEAAISSMFSGSSRSVATA